MLDQSLSTESRRLPLLNHGESVVIMEETSSTQETVSPKSIRSHHKWAARAHRDESGDENDPATVAIPHQPSNRLHLRVTLRQTRLVLLTLGVVISIVALVLFFGRGYDWSRFDSRDLTDKQRTALLDRYNSYSGSAASALSRPFEIFVSVAAHVFVLRVMAPTVLARERNGWWATGTALLLAGVVKYLIGNGFNALNVQLRPLDVRPVLSAQDLALSSDASVSEASDVVTNLRATVPETRPSNVITNTVLRGLVLPDPPQEATWCDWTQSVDNYGEMPQTVVDYGFPRFDWQRRVLQRAIESKSVRIVVSGTESNASKSEDLVSRFPMSVSVAADLFTMGTLMAPQYYPWGGRGSGLEQSANMSFVHNAIPNAVLYGLLPPDVSTVNETEQRTWFLKKSQEALIRQFEDSENTSRANIAMEFHRVDITPSIVFDAVTIEAEVDPALLTTVTRRGIRYTDLTQYSNCGPWLGRCNIPKPIYKRGREQVYDASSQVRAFAMPSRLMSQVNGSVFFSPFMEEPPRDNSSLLIVSLARRQVADELLYNTSVNATGIYPTKGNSILALNVRKFYSFTIGRLHWRLQNLSDVYSASCATSDSPLACMGLHIPLTPPLSTSTNGTLSQTQTLIVGADALPNHLVTSLKGLHWTLPRSVPLVRIHEPPRRFSDPLYDFVAGDPLLPGNIKRFPWTSIDPVVGPTGCDGQTEDRYRSIINRHAYMEHSLQTAYTSAVFFLFQNGVVKDDITLSNGSKSLKFAMNRQEIAVHFSIPWVNVVLSLVGCAALAVGLGGVALQAKLQNNPSTKDPLGAIHTPEAIASVLKDEVHFPPLLLHRHVVHDDEKNSSEDVEEFIVKSLMLIRRNASDSSHWEATSNNT